MAARGVLGARRLNAITSIEQHTNTLAEKFGAVLPEFQAFRQPDEEHRQVVLLELIAANLTAIIQVVAPDEAMEAKQDESDSVDRGAVSGDCGFPGEPVQPNGDGVGSGAGVNHGAV